MEEINKEEEKVFCVMCKAPNVTYYYPAPMCYICHDEWAE